MQNTVERAVILTETGRPVTAAALGLPGDYASEPPPAALAEDSPNDFAAKLVSAGAANGHVSVTDGSGGVLTIAALEKQAIRAALRQTEGNRTQAAALLGISIRTLRNKLQEYRDAGDPVDAGLESAEA
jgi:DNA-binding NtrC family response regulator